MSEQPHRQRNPIARSPLLRKGGIHERKPSGHRQDEKIALREELDVYLLEQKEAEEVFSAPQTIVPVEPIADTDASGPTGENATPNLRSPIEKLARLVFFLILLLPCRKPFARFTALGNTSPKL